MATANDIDWTNWQSLQWTGDPMDTEGAPVSRSWQGQRVYIPEMSVSESGLSTYTGPLMWSGGGSTSPGDINDPRTIKTTSVATKSSGSNTSKSKNMGGGTSGEVYKASTPPSMAGVLTGVPPVNIKPWDVGTYNLANYSLPSATGLFPSTQWYNKMAPSVLEAFRKPAQTEAEQLLETLSSLGQAGNPRGGASGSAAAALGNYWGQANPLITRQAWETWAPGAFTEYGSELQRAINLYNAEQGRNQNLWSAQLGANQWATQTNTAQDLALRGEYQQERAADYGVDLNASNINYNNLLSMWGMENQMNQYPYQIATNYYPNTFATPIVTQNGGGKK